MKIFYECLGGYHTTTGEFIPCSVSIEVRNDGGVKLSRGDLFLPVIWGNPTIIYTYFSPSHGTSEYFDWESQVNELVSQVLQEAVRHESYMDTDASIVSWQDIEWLPVSLKGLKKHLVSYETGQTTTTLSELARDKGFVMNSVDTDGRLDFTIHEYYNFKSRIG